MAVGVVKGCKRTFYSPIIIFETIRVAQNLWRNPLESVENYRNMPVYPHWVLVTNSPEWAFSKNG